MKAFCIFAKYLYLNPFAVHIVFSNFMASIPFTLIQGLGLLYIALWLRMDMPNIGKKQDLINNRCGLKREQIILIKF